eukprot:CAMPEP_0117421672 /NCGR_PEP_ID=MMETSP0758-20121206/2696_1 /TAXON_ID=63605 /ORGANISM="Percolomonas cosmopolitus, Strain AE-1 (ATCC 50343)" /LENGTH=421 /DNA_ID=CAMNT_0005203895 /DNA_START=292 /DNA_END=1557 /DNA_ORIENTATION=+
MMGRRAALDTLSHDMRQEEIQCVDVMKRIVRSVTLEKEHYKERESRLKKRLTELEDLALQERQDKEKLQQTFSTFKRQGEQIIARLRDGQIHLKEKLKQERIHHQANSAKLNMVTKQLAQEQEQSKKLSQLYDDAMETVQSRKYNQLPSSSNSKNHDDDISAIVASKTQAMSTKIFTLTRALKQAKEDNEKLRSAYTHPSSPPPKSVDDDELESLTASELRELLRAERIAWFDKEFELSQQLKEYDDMLTTSDEITHTLRQTIQQLRVTSEKHDDTQPASVTELMNQFMADNPSLNHNFLELYGDLKKFMDPDSDVAPQGERDLAQRKLIQLLLERLKKEEHSRLKTEEQANELIQGAEKQIMVLENKVREQQKVDVDDAPQPRKQLLKQLDPPQSPSASPQQKKSTPPSSQRSSPSVVEE